MRGRRYQTGQIIFLMMFLLIPLMLLIGYILNGGAVTASRAKLQNAVDSSVMTEAAWVARSLNIMSQNNTAITQSVVVGTAAFALEGPIHFSGQQAGEVAGHYLGRAWFLIEKAMAIPPPVGPALAIVTAGYYTLMYEELMRKVLAPLKNLHDKLKKAVFDGYCLLSCSPEHAGLARAAYAFGKMNTLIQLEGARVVEQASKAQAVHNGVNGTFKRYSGWGWDEDSHRDLRMPVVKQSLMEGSEQIRDQVAGGSFTLGSLMSSSEHVRNLLNIRSTGETGTYETIANLEFDYFSNFDNHGHEKGTGPYIDPNGGENKLVKKYEEIHGDLETLSEGVITENPVEKAFKLIDVDPPSCSGLNLIANFPYCMMKKIFNLALNTLVKPFTNTETEISENDLAERIENVWKWASLWRDMPYSAEFDDSAGFEIDMFDYSVAVPPRFFWTFAIGVSRGRQPPGVDFASSLSDFESAGTDAVSGGLDDVYDRAKAECERQGQITLNTETYPAIEARGDLPEDHPQYLTDNQIESLKESEEDAMKARCRAEAEQKKREAEETAGSTEGFGGGETAAMGNAADNPQEANKKEGQITSENKAKAAGRADWLNYALWRPEWFYQAIVKNSIPFSVGDYIDGFGAAGPATLAFSMFEIDLYAVRQPRLLPELSNTLSSLGGEFASVARSLPHVGPTREDWSIVHMATGSSGAPIFSDGFPGVSEHTSAVSQAEVYNAQWFDLYTQHWRAKHSPASLIACGDCESDREKMREILNGEQGADVLQNFLQVEGGGNYENLATH
jgi:hypothetical protein